MKDNKIMSDPIVIGPDHYNTLWLVRSLGMAGFNPFVIIVSSKSKSFVAKSRYCRNFVLVASNESMLSMLIERKVEGKSTIFTSSDAIAACLDCNLHLLSDKYILQHCNNEQGGVLHWMKKENMLAMAASCGLTIPKTKAYSTNQQINMSELVFPCLIKPELSAESSKDNFRICKNELEFTSAINEIRDKCSRIVVQEYIQSEYECLVYGVSTDSEICLPGGLRKIHTCTSNNNLGMMSYACLSREIPLQLMNLDAIKEFIRAIGYKGLFSVEFMITKDEAYFLEINLRNDGTCYITTQAGVNLPAIWAYFAMGLDSSHLSRTLKRQCAYGMNEINYMKYTFSFRHMFKCIKEILKVSAFSLIKFDDMRPVLFKIINEFV